MNYQPKKDTAIQICIGLKLNLDKTIDLLSKAGFGLSAASERDLVIKYVKENEDAVELILLLLVKIANACITSGKNNNNNFYDNFNYWQQLYINWQK